jgi:hypothetical protein
MADILKILLIIVGILIVYVSYWLLSEALFPRLVDRACELYQRPLRLTLVGLATAILPVSLGLVLSSLPNPLSKLLGITLWVVPAMLGLAGSAGLTLRIGAGLPMPTDATQPWRRVFRGGILLAFSFLLPVVGWIVIPIWVLVSGFGAFILCVKERKTQAISPVPPLATADPVAG